MPTSLSQWEDFESSSEFTGLSPEQKSTSLLKWRTDFASQQPLSPEETEILDTFVANKNKQYSAPPPPPPAKEMSFISPTEVVSSTWDVLRGIPVSTKAAYYQLKEGLSRPYEWSPEYKQAMAEKDAFDEEIQKKQAELEASGEATTFGTAARKFVPSTGFSTTGMASALVGSIPGRVAGGAIGGWLGGAGATATGAGAVAAPLAVGGGAALGQQIGGFIGGALASGTAAYRMAGSEFLRSAFKQAEKNTGRPLTKEEVDALYDQLQPLAENTGLWEAGPEAVTNAVGLGVTKALFGLGKGALTKLAKTALGKASLLAGDTALEVAGETATEAGGQAWENAKMEAVLQGKDPSAVPNPRAGLGGIVAAAEEVGPAAVYGSLFMPAAIGTVKAGVSLVSGKKEAPKTVSPEEFALRLAASQREAEANLAKAYEERSYGKSAAAYSNLKSIGEAKKLFQKGDIQEAADIFNLRIGRPSPEERADTATREAAALTAPLVDRVAQDVNAAVRQVFEAASNVNSTGTAPATAAALADLGANLADQGAKKVADATNTAATLVANAANDAAANAVLAATPTPSSAPQTSTSGGTPTTPKFSEEALTTSPVPETPPANITAEGLPPIPDGMVRLTHSTSGQAIRATLQSGRFDYSKQAVIDATADSFGNNQDLAERLNTGMAGPMSRGKFGDKVLIMDVPVDEYRRMQSATVENPGFVPANRIVAVYDNNSKRLFAPELPQPPTSAATLAALGTTPQPTPTNATLQRKLPEDGQQKRVQTDEGGPTAETGGRNRPVVSGQGQEAGSLNEMLGRNVVFHGISGELGKDGDAYVVRAADGTVYEVGYSDQIPDNLVLDTDFEADAEGAAKASLQMAGSPAKRLSRSEDGTWSYLGREGYAVGEPVLDVDGNMLSLSLTSPDGQTVELSGDDAWHVAIAERNAAPDAEAFHNRIIQRARAEQSRLAGMAAPMVGQQRYGQYDMTREQAYRGLAPVMDTVEAVDKIHRKVLRPEKAGILVLPSKLNAALDTLRAVMDRINATDAANKQELLEPLRHAKALLELEIEKIGQESRAATPEGADGTGRTAAGGTTKNRRGGTPKQKVAPAKKEVDLTEGLPRQQPGEKPDIIEWLKANYSLRPISFVPKDRRRKGTAEAEAMGILDGLPFPAKRRLFSFDYGEGRNVTNMDEVANLAYEANEIPSNDPTVLAQAIIEAFKNRKAGKSLIKEGDQQMETAEQRTLEFEKAVASGPVEVDPTTLGFGNTVTIAGDPMTVSFILNKDRDPEFLILTGPKFGEQRLDPNMPFRADKEPDTSNSPSASDFLPKEEPGAQEPITDEERTQLADLQKAVSEGTLSEEDQAKAKDTIRWLNVLSGLTSPRAIEIWRGYPSATNEEQRQAIGDDMLAAQNFFDAVGSDMVVEEKAPTEKKPAAEKKAPAKKKPAAETKAPTEKKPAAEKKPVSEKGAIRKEKRDKIKAESNELLASLREKARQMSGRTNIGVDPKLVAEISVLLAKLSSNALRGGMLTFEEFVEFVAANLADVWDQLRNMLAQAWKNAIRLFPDANELPSAAEVEEILNRFAPTQEVAAPPAETQKGIDPLNVELGFGKKRRQSINQLLETDPNYLFVSLFDEERTKGITNRARLEEVRNIVRSLPQYAKWQEASNLTAEQLVEMNAPFAEQVQQGINELASLGIEARLEEGGPVSIQGSQTTTTYENQLARNGFIFNPSTRRFYVGKHGNFVQLVRDIRSANRGEGQGTGSRRNYVSAQRRNTINGRRDGVTTMKDASELTQDDITTFTDKTSREIIMRGKEAGMPDDILSEQITDAALISSAHSRGEGMFMLASDPGTGKTFVIASALRSIIQRLKDGGISEPKIILVTNNQKLINQFKDDTKAFDIEGSVTFMTYASLDKTDTTNKPQDSDVLVFDEAHNIRYSRSGQSARSAYAEQWIKKSKFVLMSSATPYEDLSQMEFLAPTGIFEEFDTEELYRGKQGFYGFAAVFGGRVTLNSSGNPSGVQWTLTGDAALQAQSDAREYLRKRGLFTQRAARLPENMVFFDYPLVEGEAPWVALYNQIDRVKSTAKGLDENTLMYITNLQKRILEASKGQAAIDMARKELADGRKVVIFVETKSERNYNLPEEIAKFDAYVEAGGDMSEDARKAAGIMFEGAIKLFRALVNEGVTEINFPSAKSTFTNAFKEDVAFYTGDEQGEVGEDSLGRWKEGDVNVLVATMARGGTGLSLHDKIGNDPRTQIVITLPWRGTDVEQVSKRIARYGMKSAAKINWLFTNQIPFERRLSAVVGARMANMGAIVKGVSTDISQRVLSATDFEVTRFGEIVMQNDSPEASVDAAFNKVKEETRLSLSVPATKGRRLSSRDAVHVREAMETLAKAFPFMRDIAIVDTAENLLKRTDLTESEREAIQNGQEGFFNSATGKTVVVVDNVVMLDEHASPAAAIASTVVHEFLHRGLESARSRPELADLILKLNDEMLRHVTDKEIDALVLRGYSQYQGWRSDKDLENSAREEVYVRKLNAAIQRGGADALSNSMVRNFVEWVKTLVRRLLGRFGPKLGTDAYYLYWAKRILNASQHAPQYRLGVTRPSISLAASSEYADAVEQGDSGNDNLNQLLRDASPDERQAVVDSWIKRNPRAATRMQEIVAEAAKAAGYDSPKVYHGTQARFNVFDESKIGSANGRLEGAGFYFTTDRTIAEGYQRNGGNVISAYLKIRKALDYNQKAFSTLQIRNLLKAVALTEAKDLLDGNWRDGFLANYGDTYSKGIDAVIAEASSYFTNEATALDQIGGIIGSGVDPTTVNEALSSSLGYDAFFSKGFSGKDKKGGDIYVATKSNQVKSADPVTFDNAGNIIPPPQRFQTTSPDIRFSTPAPVSTSDQQATATDAEYLAAVEAGDMEKAQRMVDEAARKVFSFEHPFNDEYEILIYPNPFNREFFAVHISPKDEFYSYEKQIALIGTGVFNTLTVIKNKLAEFGISKITISGEDSKRDKVFNSLAKRAGFKQIERVGLDGDPIIGWELPWANLYSADPVTRDDQGNVIPLSQRFQPTSPDIRQSPTDTETSQRRLDYLETKNKEALGRLGLPTDVGTHGQQNWRSVLETMRDDRLTTRLEKVIIEALLKLDWSGLDFVVRSDGRLKNAGQWIDGETATIEINLRSAGRGRISLNGLVLHELLHHATSRKIKNPANARERAVVASLTQLLGRIRNYAMQTGDYGRFQYELDSVDEFIAALFPNRPHERSFVAFLDTVPDSFRPRSRASKFIRSALSRIAELLSRLFGTGEFGRDTVLGDAIQQSLALVLGDVETDSATEKHLLDRASAMLTNLRSDPVALNYLLLAARSGSGFVSLPELFRASGMTFDSFMDRIRADDASGLAVLEPIEDTRPMSEQDKSFTIALGDGTMAFRVAYPQVLNGVYGDPKAMQRVEDTVNLRQSPIDAGMERESEQDTARAEMLGSAPSNVAEVGYAQVFAKKRGEAYYVKSVDNSRAAAVRFLRLTFDPNGLPVLTPESTARVKEATARILEDTARATQSGDPSLRTSPFIDEFVRFAGKDASVPGVALQAELIRYGTILAARTGDLSVFNSWKGNYNNTILGHYFTLAESGRALQMRGRYSSEANTAFDLLQKTMLEAADAGGKKLGVNGQEIDEEVEGAGNDLDNSLPEDSDAGKRINNAKPPLDSMNVLRRALEALTGRAKESTQRFLRRLAVLNEVERRISELKARNAGSRQSWLDDALTSDADFADIPNDLDGLVNLRETLMEEIADLADNISDTLDTPGVEDAEDGPLDITLETKPDEVSEPAPDNPIPDDEVGQANDEETEEDGSEDEAESEADAAARRVKAIVERFIKKQFNVTKANETLFTKIRDMVIAAANNDQNANRQTVTSELLAKLKGLGVSPDKASKLVDLAWAAFLLMPEKTAQNILARLKSTPEVAEAFGSKRTKDVKRAISKFIRTPANAKLTEDEAVAKLAPILEGLEVRKATAVAVAKAAHGAAISERAKRMARIYDRVLSPGKGNYSSVSKAFANAKGKDTSDMAWQFAVVSEFFVKNGLPKEDADLMAQRAFAENKFSAIFSEAGVRESLRAEKRLRKSIDNLIKSRVAARNRNATIVKQPDGTFKNLSATQKVRQMNIRALYRQQIIVPASFGDFEKQAAAFGASSVEARAMFDLANTERRVRELVGKSPTRLSALIAFIKENTANMTTDPSGAAGTVRNPLIRQQLINTFLEANGFSPPQIAAAASWVEKNLVDHIVAAKEKALASAVKKQERYRKATLAGKQETATLADKHLARMRELIRLGMADPSLRASQALAEAMGFSAFSDADNRKLVRLDEMIQRATAEGRDTDVARALREMFQLFQLRRPPKTALEVLAITYNNNALGGLSTLAINTVAPFGSMLTRMVMDLGSATISRDMNRVNLISDSFQKAVSDYLNYLKFALRSDAYTNAMQQQVLQVTRLNRDFRDGLAAFRDATKSMWVRLSGAARAISALTDITRRLLSSSDQAWYATMQNYFLKSASYLTLTKNGITGPEALALVTQTSTEFSVRMQAEQSLIASMTQRVQALIGKDDATTTAELDAFIANPDPSFDTTNESLRMLDQDIRGTIRALRVPEWNPQRRVREALKELRTQYLSVPLRMKDIARHRLSRTVAELVSADTDIQKKIESDLQTYATKEPELETGNHRGEEAPVADVLNLFAYTVRSIGNSALRKNPILGRVFLGYFGVPINLLNRGAWLTPYGLFRYILAKKFAGKKEALGIKSDVEFYRQSAATDLQLRQRLMEAIVGSSSLVAIMLLQTMSGDDDEPVFKVTLAGPANKTERDAWIKQGHHQGSLELNVAGKRATMSWARGLLEPWKLNMILAGAVDDMRLNRKLGHPLNASSMGEYLGAVMSGFHEQATFLGAKSTIGFVAGKGPDTNMLGSVLYKANPVIPFSGLIASVERLFVGPDQNRGRMGAIWSNLPIARSLLTRRDVNALGDPRGFPTGDSLATIGNRLYLSGLLPLAITTPPSPPDAKIYEFIMERGAGPGLPQRGAIEARNGLLSDDQWIDYVTYRGKEVKRRLGQSLGRLRNMDDTDLTRAMGEISSDATERAKARYRLK